MSENYPRELKEAIKFHGHLCPGLAIGFMASAVAMEKLGIKRSEDEEIVAIVESDGCAIDAIQSILGCSIGKGNLIFRDYGKMVFTIIRRNPNRAIRIALAADVFRRDRSETEVMRKAFSGEASDNEWKQFRALQKKWVEEILNKENEELFVIREVSIDVPEKARIFDTVVCHFCGERVMEPRARLREGKPACIPCSEEYSRGW